MGPFGIPWLLFWLEMLAGPGMLIIAIIMIKSKWWKSLTEYYFSWNQKETEEEGEGQNE